MPQSTNAHNTPAPLYPPIEHLRVFCIQNCYLYKYHSKDSKTKKERERRDDDNGRVTKEEETAHEGESSSGNGQADDASDKERAKGHGETYQDFSEGEGGRSCSGTQSDSDSGDDEYCSGDNVPSHVVSDDSYEETGRDSPTCKKQGPQTRKTVKVSTV